MGIRSLGAVLALLCVADAASAENMTPIDCSDTPFTFSDPSYEVACERADGPVRVEDVNAGLRVDVINVKSADRTKSLTVVSRLINSPRIYMEYQNLGQNFRMVFAGEKTKDWKGIGRKSGYDVAEFVNGMDAKCITMQRYANASYGGFRRHVIGMGCTVGEIDSLYEMLGKLDAPGD